MNEYERALWHVIAGWAFHNVECPATESDIDDACDCGFTQAMREAHDAYKRTEENGTLRAALDNVRAYSDAALNKAPDFIPDDYWSVALAFEAISHIAAQALAETDPGTKGTK